MHTHVLGIVVVDGESMAPSLHKGDHLLIEKVSPRLGVVDRGDVVVLRKGDSGELLVKPSPRGILDTRVILRAGVGCATSRSPISGWHASCFA